MLEANPDHAIIHIRVPAEASARLPQLQLAAEQALADQWSRWPEIPPMKVDKSV